MSITDTIPAVYTVVGFIFIVVGLHCRLSIVAPGLVALQALCTVAPGLVALHALYSSPWAIDKVRNAP